MDLPLSFCARIVVYKKLKTKILLIDIEFNLYDQHHSWRSEKNKGRSDCKYVQTELASQSPKVKPKATEIPLVYQERAKF